MLLRSAVVVTSLFAVAPAFAEPLNAEAARHFVAGKLFSFTCFEGTSGSGRIFNDGSVAGVVRMGGNGSTRFMHLPPGTLFTKGEAVCSYVKGAFFNPCFNLTKTSDKGFRGAVSGFGFAYCDFVRHGGAREMVASVMPTEKSHASAHSIRHARRLPKETASAAITGSTTPISAPTTPVVSAPLAAPEATGIRTSITP